jgi:hypothetical protein
MFLIIRMFKYLVFAFAILNIAFAFSMRDQIFLAIRQAPNLTNASMGNMSNGNMSSGNMSSGNMSSGNMTMNMTNMTATNRT